MLCVSSMLLLMMHQTSVSLSMVSWRLTGAADLCAGPTYNRLSGICGILMRDILSPHSGNTCTRVLLKACDP